MGNASRLAPSKARRLHRAPRALLVAAALVAGLAAVGGPSVLPGGAASDPNFVVSTTPASASVIQGESTSVVVTVLGEHSYDGPPATVSVPNAPTGLTPSCSPNPVRADTTCTLTLAAWPNASTGVFRVQVDADNGTAVRSTNITLTVYPAPAVALDLNESVIELEAGQSASVNASVTFTGPPGAIANLSLIPPTFDFLQVSVAPGSLGTSGNATISIAAAPNATNQSLVVAVVAQVKGATSTAQFRVNLRASGTPSNGGTPGAGNEPGSVDPTTSSLPSWLLPLILVGVLAAGAGLVIATRRARAVPAAARPDEKEAYLVEDVFLLYKDGRMLFSRTGLGGDEAPDPEVVGSMLVAIQDFVRDSFSKGAGVDHMSYGENAILLERGEHVILAVTIFGRPGDELRERMKEAVGTVEAQYAGVIERWDGDRAAFAGAEEVLHPLWAPTSGLTRAEVTRALTSKEVQVLSGVEFFQGFVRLKVAVQNNTDGDVDAVSVAIDHNADVLRLDRVEPPSLRRTGTTVLVGSVRAGDRSTVAFYFDPQICTSSSLDGVCRYTTQDGRQLEAPMKARRAEVVCPLFFTAAQANTATLRRLIEEQLHEFDVRAFALPPLASDLDMSRVFSNLRAAVSAHEVQEVRAHESWRPYSGQAWFYGKTQKGQEMVIRASVDETAGRAEFYVAARSMRAVTGLLAEISHTLRRNAEAGGTTRQLDPIHGGDVRAAYRDAHMVSRMLEGEVEAGETSA